MLEKIKETASFLRERMHTHPEIAVILGTGLGHLADHISETLEIPYKDIPNFPVSTVEGHAGKLIFGKLGGKDIMAMEGRFHYYEGYSMQEVTFPIRVMYELGIKTLFVSNASGATNPDYEVGDLMIITDHINYFPEHPLRGKNLYNDRFPNMGEPYDKKLIQLALDIAKEKGIKVQQGVYLGTQGTDLRDTARISYVPYVRRRRSGHVHRSRSYRRSSLQHAGVRYLGRHRLRRGEAHHGGEPYFGTGSSRQLAA
jgi:purine-nucleoside phosphorylase